LSCRLL